ncbi:o-succinylbenzoate synthase [Fredinandcohnia quinoae]|uniref:o-succinylbenzoate synthase n=1 Tax=Fredinandcohnia quinoae TaxID=2918902 RepID=A0AAW5E9K1_9BACI|nr:o-succinylbenzoate synthase [Fredinandcohnia sp. SECRCQ15]MCH1625434.1 o-succinylbenzoate synthase [Fredinandcohnia sp. SECRCQ15]
MKIKKITLHLIEQRLLSPFVSSLGKVDFRESILVEVEDYDGLVGWGEVVAFSSPWYTEETIKTSWHIIEDFFVKSLLYEEIEHPNELQSRFQSVKRNQMAKAGLEIAIWDLYAKVQGISLSNAIGGTKDKIESGVVVSIDTFERMLGKIQVHIDEGYKRVKIKIKPGQDYEILKEIRKVYPDLSLMVDANSAYTLEDIERLRALDEFKLMMIEQPLAADDIIDHAKLQKEIMTPVCLDESIVTYEDARKAIEMGSCRVINLKIGRVGGISEAIKIHNLCLEHHIPVWCGGMLETGISRAHNIALASLPGFTIPGDISASSRYWSQDVIKPEVIVENGYIHVPKEAGIGFEVDRIRIQQLTKMKKVF